MKMSNDVQPLQRMATVKACVSYIFIKVIERRDFFVWFGNLVVRTDTMAKAYVRQISNFNIQMVKEWIQRVKKT